VHRGLNGTDFEVRAMSWQSGRTRVRRSILLAIALTAVLCAARAGAVPENEAAAATPLAALLDEAMRNNAEIHAARDELEAAQQRTASAGALEDPMLEAGVVSLPVPSYSFSREDMTMKMLGLAQQLPFPGKRGLRIEVARKDAESVGYAYTETVNRVLRDLKLAYFELGLALRSTQLTERNKQVLEQFLAIAESRYAVGQGTQADVLKAQTQLSRVQNELIELDRERPMAEAELARALGRAGDIGGIAPETPPAQEPGVSLESLRTTALAQRPQLLALQKLVERNEKAVELARKDYYPDFDVRFSYGQRDDMPDGESRDPMVSLSVGFNLPVWRAAKLDPRVREAIAMRDQARDMYLAQTIEVGSMLRRQFAAAEQYQKSAQLYQRSLVPQARLAVEAALAAYRVGRVDFLMLLDSQMSVFEVEIGNAAALAGYHKALAEIDLLTGKPADDQLGGK
jgi:cobalt-zinc-cadmium efflux system outer membrane protein